MRDFGSISLFVYLLPFMNLHAGNQKWDILYSVKYVFFIT